MQTKAGFLHFKSSDFFLFLWLSMSHIKRKKWALFVPLKMGQVASALENKIIEKGNHSFS